MIAKFDGKCKVTGKRIIAGVTNIEKINGIWQIAEKSNGTGVPVGATIVMAYSDVYQDRYGDEYLSHEVYFADDDGEPIGTIWKFTSEPATREYAEKLYYDNSGVLQDLIIELAW